MNRYFGYARISTPQQSIERQIRNILAAYPQSEIIREVFTGTKFQGRREFEKLLKKLNAGDTIIFVRFPECPVMQKKVLPCMRIFSAKELILYS